ncbi:M48 family metalloprotease [Paenibacillus sp. NPDC058910]|uniref:M48 family metalloprotease n=1 Tax=Paenibacillus sp. NPDC058910 TaxID=3346670 RepID=UPI0036C61B9A
MVEYFRHNENIRKYIQKVNEQLLKHVIAHELTHYKRKDTIWNMVGSLYFHLMIELGITWFYRKREERLLNGIN